MVTRTILWWCDLNKGWVVLGHNSITYITRLKSILDHWQKLLEIMYNVFSTVIWYYKYLPINGQVFYNAALLKNMCKICTENSSFLKNNFLDTIDGNMKWHNLTWNDATISNQVKAPT